MKLLIGLFAVMLAACSGGGAASSAPSVTKTLPSAAPFDIGSIQDSVAFITTQGTFVTPDGALEQRYTGTGFVVDPDGYILTNNHVVTGGAFWKVKVGKDETTQHDAQLVAVSECSDLALLHITGTYPALRLAPAVPAPGQPIYVAGHPNGDPYTITNGIIAKDPYAAETSWASVKQEVQITAQTFAGNSGSPVIDAKGDVIGIEYASGDVGSDIAGESFAIASSEAAPVIEKLKTGASTETIGINGEANKDKTGIAVISVAPGSPADKAEIKAGDLLTNLNGTAVGTDGSKATYCSVLRSHLPADTLSVGITRNGQPMTGEINGRVLTASAAASPTPGAAVTAAPGGALAEVRATVPSAILPTCSEASKDSWAVGAIETLVCTVDDATGVDGVFYDLFPSADAVTAYYNSEKAGYNAKTVDGDCNNGAEDTTYTLTFTDGKKIDGPGYRVLCFKTDNGSAWLEQADPGTKIIVSMLLKSGDQDKLWKWWLGNSTTKDVEP